MGKISPELAEALGLDLEGELPEAEDFLAKRPVSKEEEEETGLSNASTSGDKLMACLKQLKHKKRDFLLALIANGSQTEALREVNVTGTQVNMWQLNDPVFRRGMLYALHTMAKQLHQTLFDRALNGWEEPVFQGGELVGYKRKFDNDLAWKLLLAHNKQIRNRVQPRHDTTINNTKIDAHEGTVQIMLPDNGRKNREINE